MRSASLRRGAAVMAVAALSITTFGAPVAAAVDARPSGLAGDWMSGQLTEGLSVGGFGPDIGLSIDAGLAFDALGRSASAAEVAEAIGPGLVTSENFEYGYVKATEYDHKTGAAVQVGKYSNATAKAAAFTQRLGRSANAAYADVDLIAQLEELTSDTTGQIADSSSYGNYANTIGQAFAAEALTVDGSPEAAAATASLLQQQCPAGYFRFALAATECADATDVAHPDVTALAIVSLTSSGSTAAAVTDAIAAAAGWLESVQEPDGSFGGEATTPGSNANTTGLAGWALGAAGRTAPAVAAAGWTRGLQSADAGACTTALSSETGAIAYDAAALGAGRAGGVTSGTRDQWRRTTFQAAPVLSWAPAAESTPAISAPASAIAGAPVTVTVTGLALGESACVSLGAQKRMVTGTGGPLTLIFDLPAGAATHTFTLDTLAGSQRAETVATPSPSLSPSPSPSPSTTPAPATTQVGQLEVAKVVKVRKNRLVVRVACEGTTACAGRVVLRTARKVKPRPAARAHRVRISQKSYTVAPGNTVKVVLRVRKQARALLATGRVRVQAVQSAPSTDRVVTRFWLRRIR